MEETEDVGQAALGKYEKYSATAPERKDCSNFNFLRKIADLSKQRLTKCPCSRIEKAKSALPDIRSHFSAKANKSIALPIG